MAARKKSLISAAVLLLTLAAFVSPSTAQIVCLDVTKVADREVAQVGDTVTYELCVYNCGDTIFDRIDVVDWTLGYVFIPIYGFAPGEVWCTTLEYEIQPGDPDPFINEVQVIGFDEAGNREEDWATAVVDLVEVGTVALDIKPTSCPNPLNVESKGVLPVAILGTENFDVSDVDVGSVSLEGVAPISFSYEDVATPFDGELCDCHEAGPDGYLDLTLKFDAQQIVTALGSVQDGDHLVLTAAVTMKDGAIKEGSDCIRIIKKGKDRLKTKTVKTAVIVDDSSYTVADAEISTAIELAGSWLFTLSGVGMELHSIDHVPSITGSKSAFIDNWYLTHFPDPPHFIVILSFDENSATYGGYAITSSVLPGFCNEFNSPVFGNGRIYGAVIDWTHRFAACGYDLEHYRETGNWVVVDTSSLADGSCTNQAGVPCVSVPTVSYQVCGNVDADLPYLEHERSFIISVFIHELMHAFGTNGNMDHFGTTVCDTAMGGEAYKDGGLFTAQHFCGMCPTVYQNVSESYAACP
jgi:hypothetical protein